MSAWFDEIGELGDALSAELSRIAREAERLGDDAAMALLRAWNQLDALPSVPPVFGMPPVGRQLYGHGAFMGAAPALLADETWRRILAFLMPDVYASVRDAVDREAPASALIPMFENNPVMAAFGVLHTLGPNQDNDWRHDNIGIEWDLFIDGDLAEAHETTAAAARPALIEQILASAVIAHAGAIDTLQETLGFCQHADVRATPKAELGGVEVASWLDLFARALQLAQADDPATVLHQMASEPRVTDTESCVWQTFVHPLSAQEAVATFRAVTGRPHLSIVLDMKSLRSTPELFVELVQALNAQGIHVAVAASFVHEEIEGIAQMTQIIDGEALPGPREVLFFHFAGGLQRACDASPGLPAGTSVLFNGACLLTVESDGWFSGTARYAIKQDVVGDLARYQRRHGLEIGLYVQEGDCDTAAAALLAQLVEDHPETFSLGFAWGGLRDLAACEPIEEARLGHGSQRALTLVKRAWRVSRTP